MHPGFKMLVCLIGTTLWAPGGLPVVRAESADSPGSAKVDPPPPASHGGIAEVITAGARLLGKGGKTESAPKDFQEAESKGSSSSSAKKAALAALPLDQLTPENKQRVNTLLKSSSFYRRLPKVTFAIEPEVYSYFVAHPDVAVSIWRAMKISKLEMWQTGKFDYEADTGDGSTGKLEVLHTGVEKNLVTCDGLYKSPMFKQPIAAQSLLLLQTSFFREADGTVYVTHRADLFVTFPSQTVDVVSKIFSPLAVSMTDRTFTEVSLFLKMMSMAMSRRPDWVEQIAQKMEGIPDVRKTQVMELTAQVYSAAQKRAVERVADKDDVTTGSREAPRSEGAIAIPTVAGGGDAVPAGGSVPGTARLGGEK